MFAIGYSGTWGQISQSKQRIGVFMASNKENLS